MMNTGVSAFAFAVAFVTATSADVITVPPSQSINAAIASASDGDIIQLEPGVYAEGSVIDTQSKALEIVGFRDALGRPLTIIDGQDQHRVFQCTGWETEDTVLRDLKIVNGRAEEGAGLYCTSGAAPLVVDCIFSGHNKGEIGWHTIFSPGGSFCPGGPDYVDLLRVSLCDNGADPGDYIEGCTSNGEGLCLTVSCEDCNGNGIPDGCDLSSGTSGDCNGNGLPDECDVTDGSSPDCNENWVPDECDYNCDGNGIPDPCVIASSDCDGNGIDDRDDGPLFSVCAGALTPVDLIVVYDPSGSQSGTSETFCNSILPAVSSELSDVFDLRTAWVSVVNADSECDTWTMPIGTPVPVCGALQGRFINDAMGEEWGDATAVMTAPYAEDLLGQFSEWHERDAVLILVTVSDEGPQGGEGCGCDDSASAWNLVQQALLQNAQVITVPTAGTLSCVYDSDDSDSLMQFVADQTDGAVLDARDWSPSSESSTASLITEFVTTLRETVAQSPRICGGGADLNCDSEIGGADLTLLLAAWGSSGDSLPEDLNGDGEVSGPDLTFLLANWGPCS